MMIIIMFCLVSLSLIIAVNYKEYLDDQKWAAKFREGTKVYTQLDEEGVVVCVKGNKAFVRFYHENSWRNLKDLIPYSNLLD